MEKQSNNLEKQINKENSGYAGIFEFLKNGARKMEKDIRKTREAKFSYRVQEIREELFENLKTVNPKVPKLQHINILESAIRKTVRQLENTKNLFHSKRLFKVREDANNLLKEVKKQCKEIHTGGQPMGK